jgi:uncharacterized membrane protein
MDLVFLLLKFLHIVAIIVWVGGTFALVMLNMRAGRSGDITQQAAMGRLSESFGRVVIGPAMGIALLAGIFAAGKIGFSFSSPWIVWGLVGWVLSLAIGVIAVGRASGELSAVMQSAGATDPRVESLRGRLIALNVVNLLILASVVWVMIAKPAP